MKNTSSSHGSARRRRGFSLVELLIVIAAISCVAAMAIVQLSGTTSSVKDAKLRQDVAALNSAVRAYLLSGGNLTTTSTAAQVIQKLKTTAANSQRSKIAGLKGTMIDLRIVGIPSAEDNADRAVWQPVTQSFAIQPTGSGFRSFVLDEAAIPSTLAQETRSTTLDLDTADNWIWSYTENTTPSSSPTTTYATTPTPVVAANENTTPTVLLSPGFSKPGALYPFSDFNPDLKVSLLERNPADAVQTYYSLSNGPWIPWDGKSLSIPLSLSTELRAFSAPLDPDKYEQSAVAAALYETIFFSGGSTGLFNSPIGDPGLITNLTGTLANSLFTWGSPAIALGLPNPNSLSFAGKNFGNISPDQTFELGTLTYYNGSTYAGTNATSVRLTINLNLSTPAAIESLPFTFNLLSTPNKNKNDDDDADYVYIPNVSTQFNTTIKGQIFYLVLGFGSNNGNGYTTINEFHVHENKTMSGTIYGKFTTSPAPALP